MTDYYATRFTPDPSRSEVWRHVATHLSRWIDADGALLDLAAGYADLTRHARAARKVAIDVNPQLTTFVGPDVEAIVGDATDLDRFDDSEFATVFASNFVEHLDHDTIDRLLTGVHRVLAPGGRLILVQPNFRLDPKRYFDDYTHRTIWTDRSLSDLVAAAGLPVEHLEPRFLPLTMKSHLSFGHRLVPLYLRLPWRPLAGQMLVIARKD
ncbi:MAG: class I SAM-dependent methyltransferase [Ilumatobacter sp.]|nr:MAG: class I SAM-dependent methyltransferase [Ilumatobacter sp.]